MTELSLIVPAYNAATFLQATLVRLREWLLVHESAEIIVVDDGSSDQTAQIAEAFARNCSRLSVLRLEQNSGKGAALRVGIGTACGQYIAFTDVDLPYGLAVLDEMFETLKQNPPLAFLYGSRSHRLSAEQKGYGLFRSYYSRLGRRGVAFFLRFFGIGDVKDTLCGVKMMTKELSTTIIAKATVNRFAMDIEWFVIARVNRYQYQDFPVELNHRKESSLRLVRDTFLIFGDIVCMAFRYLSGYYYVH